MKINRKKSVLKRMSGQNKTVIINMVGAFAVKGLSLCLAMFTMPAYIRYFQSHTVLGVWYTIASILNWVLFFDLGLGNGLRNTLPKAIAVGDKASIKQQISTTYFTMGGFVVILICLAGIVIPRLSWNEILNVSTDVVDNATLSMVVMIVFIGIMLQFVVKLVNYVLYALQKSAVVNFLIFCSSVLTLIALYILPSSTLESNLYRMAFVNVVAASLPSLVASFYVYGKLLKGCAPSLKFFRKDMIHSVLKVGISLLWLQLAFMIISSTNEFLISFFTKPEYTVDYQAYYKVFKTGAMVFSLALTPIWSAVTKAQAQKNYKWIKKIYKIFLFASLGCFVMEFMILPILQPFMDIWLGKGVIEVNTMYGVAFVFSSSLFVLHNVNTSIGNGISYFKIQLVWMTFAAIVCVPLTYIMVQITGGWIGVVVANCISLLPYEVLAPVYTFKQLDIEEKRNSGI